MARNGIICGGSLCIDVNKVIDRLPPPEHVATIVSETPDSGGGTVVWIGLIALSAFAIFRVWTDARSYG